MSHPGEEQWPNLSAPQQSRQRKRARDRQTDDAHLNANGVKRRRVEITLECERSLVVRRRKTSIKSSCEGFEPGRDDGNHHSDQEFSHDTD